MRSRAATRVAICAIRRRDLRSVAAGESSSRLGVEGPEGGDQGAQDGHGVGAPRDLPGHREDAVVHRTVLDQARGVGQKLLPRGQSALVEQEGGLLEGGRASASSWMSIPR